MFLNNNVKKVKERFKAWWNASSIDRPLIDLKVKTKPLELAFAPQDPKENLLNPKYRVNLYKQKMKCYKSPAESYEYITLYLGPGSLVVYLGSKPKFKQYTNQNIVWFERFVENWEDVDGYSESDLSEYFYEHISLMKKARLLAGEDAFLAIPDLCENIDILSVMSGAEKLCLEIMDNPDRIKNLLNDLDGIYDKCYDMFYNVVKSPDGSSIFTHFPVWGPGKTAKLQCDFSYMISKEHFDEFVLPGLRHQTETLDNTIYHLDGPGAIRHVDSLMTLEGLKALQYTAGDGNPMLMDDRYFKPVYDKVIEAGKALWFGMPSNASVEDYIRWGDKVVKRYGTDGIYFSVGTMSDKDAKKYMNHAETKWLK